MKLKPSLCLNVFLCLLLNVFLCICPLTFITEFICLVATVRQIEIILLQLVLHQLSLLWQAFTTCCVTKTTSIHHIYGRCHIMKLESGRSHPTCLTNHTESISHHWLLMPFLGTCTHMHARTHIHTHQCTDKSNFKKLGMRLV